MHTYSAGDVAGIVIGSIILGVVIGLALGFFIANKIFKKQLKKNPPITKDHIRMIYSQVGRKPTEKQVNEIHKKVTQV